MEVLGEIDVVIAPFVLVVTILLAYFQKKRKEESEQVYSYFLTGWIIKLIGT